MSQDFTQEQSIEPIDDDPAEDEAPEDADTAELDQADQPTEG